MRNWDAVHAFVLEKHLLHLLLVEVKERNAVPFTFHRFSTSKLFPKHFLIYIQKLIRDTRLVALMWV